MRKMTDTDDSKLRIKLKLWLQQISPSTLPNFRIPNFRIPSFRIPNFRIPNFRILCRLLLLKYSGDYIWLQQNSPSTLPNFRTLCRLLLLKHSDEYISLQENISSPQALNDKIRLYITKVKNDPLMKWAGERFLLRLDNLQSMAEGWKTLRWEKRGG